MSRFPDLALATLLAAAVTGPVLAQDAPAPAAPSAPAPAQAVQAPADAAPTPGASAASDTEEQKEGAGEIPVEATPAPADPAQADPAQVDVTPGSPGDQAARDQAATSGDASAWPGAGRAMQLGRAALPEEIAAWDTDVRPDGQGLPDGSGDVATGEELFSDQCAVCHGEFAEGVDNWPKLAGGQGTLNRDDPVKTVGSYWPYLSTAWDYVHRSMPFGNAQVLTPDQTYAITAYILYSNDLVADDFVLDRDSFAEIRLPNADGFIVDDRDTAEVPAFSQPACMESCKDSVEVTRHATVLDVTPDTTSGTVD